MNKEKKTNIIIAVVVVIAFTIFFGSFIYNSIKPYKHHEDETEAETQTTISAITTEEATTEESNIKQVKVNCSLCNGTGRVKYYYGEGDYEYNYGPCSSCDGKGYSYKWVETESDAEDVVICDSCGKQVDKLITKNDAAGESRTWCSNCWESYDSIMGN